MSDLIARPVLTPLQKQILDIITNLSSKKGYVQWGDFIWEISNTDIGEFPAATAFDQLQNMGLVQVSPKGFNMRPTPAS